MKEVRKKDLQGYLSKVTCGNLGNFRPYFKICINSSKSKTKPFIVLPLIL